MIYNIRLHLTLRENIMPHLLLEASTNIVETNDKIKQILYKCQELLVEKLPTQLANCKSRLIMHDVFVLGDNNPKNAFIHLTVRVLKGRSQELLSSTSRSLFELLQESFSKSKENLNLGISVEITELNDSYAK